MWYVKQAGSAVRSDRDNTDQPDIAGLTVVILRDGRHADADGRLFRDRMDGVGAVDIGEGEAEVLLHGA